MRQNITKNGNHVPGENETLKGITTNELKRYKKKGLASTIVGLFIFSLYLYIGPIVLKAVWPTFISLGDQKILMVSAMVIYPQCVLALGNFLFYLVYMGKFPFFEKYRISEQPWPWEVNQKEWRKTLKKSLKQITFNNLCVQLPALIIGLYVSGLDRCKWRTEDIPGYQTMVLHFLFMMLCEDLGSYVMHRILHEPFFYKRIHKIHHEYVATVTIAATYAHPFEYLFSNSIPAMTGLFLLAWYGHFSTFILWITVRMIDTVEVHCGYEIPWSLVKVMPFSVTSEYHSYHHSHNLGTFGSFFILWDTLFQTNNDFFIYWTAQDEKLKQKKHIKYSNSAKNK